MGELKARTAYSIAMEEKDLEISGTTLVYLKSEADKVIAEKDAEILRMIENWNRLCEKYNKFIKLKQEFCDKFKDIELEIIK